VSGRSNLQEPTERWQVFERFSQVDLHSDRVTNLQMGYLFEELIRRFSESRTKRPENISPRVK
jgi:type I restriction enzyme M protein